MCYISVIVPIYNVEKYIKRCIDSLINQTYRDIEIILVDDGSTDNCPNICDEYAAKDNRIRVVHKANSGLSDARNAGINVASGKYIMFLDADDWYIERACEQFVTYISANTGADMLVGNLLYEDGTPYSKKLDAVIGVNYPGEEYYNRFNSKINFCAVASAYRRLFLIDSDLQFITGRYHEDNHFTPRAYIAAKRIVYTGISFYVRFIRDDSITSHSDKRKNLKDMLFILDDLHEYSLKLNNKRTRNNVLDGAVGAYLSLFASANIFQYKNINKNDYIDKKLVIKCAKSNKNVLKSILYFLSPALYICIHNILKNDKKQKNK